MARPRLSLATKRLRGTVQKSRERLYVRGGKAAPRQVKPVLASNLSTIPLKAPGNTTAKERGVWRELAEQFNLQGGIPPGRLSQFRLLVSGTRRLRALPEASGAYGQLLATLSKLTAQLSSKPAAAPAAGPEGVPGGTPAAEVEAEDLDADLWRPLVYVVSDADRARAIAWAEEHRKTSPGPKLVRKLPQLGQFSIPYPREIIAGGHPSGRFADRL